jgi:hypothetical protein
MKLCVQALQRLVLRSQEKVQPGERCLPDAFVQPLIL